MEIITYGKDKKNRSTNNRIEMIPNTLDEFLPDQEEIDEIKHAQEFIRHQLEQLMEQKSINGSVEFAGSSALGTFVRGNRDIDVFVIVKVETFSDFETVFYQFTELNWLQNQHVKHGHKITEEMMTHRLAIWSGIIKYANIKQYHIDLVILPQVAGAPPHVRFETLRHVKFFKTHLKPKQKKDVIRLKGLFYLGGIYSADQWGIKGVDCQTLIYKYKTLENALKFLSTLTPASQLKDPSYESVKKDRDLFVTILQSPLASTRLKQIRSITRNYLKKRKLPQAFEKETWITHQAKTNHLIFSIPLQKEDRAETFSQAVSVTFSAINIIKGQISELRDVKFELEARLFDNTTVVSLHFCDISPTFQRSLNKRKINPKNHDLMINKFKQRSYKRAKPPLITNLQIKESSENISIIFKRNLEFALYLIIKFIHKQLLQNNFFIETWVQPALDLKQVQKHLIIDPLINEKVILNDLNRYSQQLSIENKTQEEINRAFEVYYNIGLYLQLPSVLDLNQDIQKKFRHYFTGLINEIPRSSLLQIAALYHNLGFHPYNSEIIQLDGDKPVVNWKQTLLYKSGANMGLSSIHIDYIKQIIESIKVYNENIDQSKSIDYFLLLYAIKDAKSQRSIIIQTQILNNVIIPFFSAYNDD